MHLFDLLGKAIREKKYRWRYCYLFFYALGSRFMPKIIAKQIQRDNNKNKGIIDRLKITTYDKSGQAVHPDLVMHNDNTLYLVCTPYPYAIDTYENPSVYRGTSVFNLSECTHNPISFQERREKKNHISDPCIFSSDDGLMIAFRDTVYVNNITTQKLYISQSIDGEHWSEKKLIAASQDKSYISPAIIRENGCMYLYYVDLSTEFGGKIIKASLNSMFEIEDENEVKILNLPEGMTVWHIGLAGNKNFGKSIDADESLIGIFTLRDTQTGRIYINHWARFDVHMNSWFIEEALDMLKDYSDEISNVYKSAIVPETGDVLLGYMDKEMRWYFSLVPGYRDRKELETEKSLVDSYRVFSRVFHNTMGLKQFEYKHYQNPYISKVFYLQKNEAGKTIGTNCFMGAIGTSKNDSFFTIQSCDTAVVPEARGKGVFVNLISEATEAISAQKGGDLLLGFPNNNSYHGFIKLGWKHIYTYKTYLRFTDVIGFALAKFGTKRYKYIAPDIIIHSDIIKAANMVKSVSFKCPFAQSDLDKINNADYTMIKKTMEYFTWRIDDNQGADYYYITLRNESLQGYLVYTVSSRGRVFIVDWYVDARNEFREEIMNELIQSLIKVGNVIVFPLVSEGSALEQYFVSKKWKCGNVKPFKYPISRMITYPITEKGEKYSDKDANWHITYIDLDTIIT